MSPRRMWRVITLADHPEYRKDTLQRLCRLVWFVGVLGAIWLWPDAPLWSWSLEGAHGVPLQWVQICLLIVTAISAYAIVLMEASDTDNARVEGSRAGLGAVKMLTIGSVTGWAAITCMAYFYLMSCIWWDSPRTSAELLLFLYAIPTSVLLLADRWLAQSGYQTPVDPGLPDEQPADSATRTITATLSGNTVTLAFTPKVSPEFRAELATLSGEGASLRWYGWEVCDVTWRPAGVGEGFWKALAAAAAHDQRKLVVIDRAN